MDWKQLLAAVSNHVNQNLEQMDSDNKLRVSRMSDRLKMNDPEIQGPRLPESTPEEDDANQRLMGMVVGSIGGPSGIASAFAPAVEKAGAQAVAESISNPMEKLIRGQQGISRGADYVDRFAEQAKQVKMDRLKKFLGR